jgi:3'(2'), 5'-bisphosphate nucleotidase
VNFHIPEPQASWAELSDHQLAAVLAEEAGRILVAHRDTLIANGATQSDLRNSGDSVGHHFLANALDMVRPGDELLSEEGADNVARLSARRVWIVDPLDGTKEFGQHRPDWAVHVALWEDGELVAGAVSLPAIDKVFCTDPAPQLPPKAGDKPRLVTSRSHAPYSAVLVANRMDCDAFQLGSAGAKAMSIVMGDADIYVHDGGMYQWDSAAPVVVARAAGLHCSRIDGSPFRYNEADTWLPDLIICRPEYADDVLTALWGAERPTK